MNLINNNLLFKSWPIPFSELAALYQRLIPAFIFSVLLLVCVVAMACRNIVRYFTGYVPPVEDQSLDEKDEEAAAQNNISHEYKLSETLDDTISPQNAKQLEKVDNKMTDVIYTWVCECVTSRGVVWRHVALCDWSC